ncbi:MAG: hypothetical protein ACKVS9_12635 [Phycisphaerae bacterium]
MSKRAWKTAALVGCCGVLVQFASCGLLIAQAVAQNVLFGILGELFFQLLEDNNVINETAKTVMMLG